ncbi:MAG: 16S rRNA (adenine(1518)-N(6)/adenine(1519)-N(6))-dimethyltransferase RsmA [Dehalococcoidia bacterium]|nr:16S rRNA (adenine(1518)-N(6)/adenine(1519)-N(6))-dimethyltransferase RsmA [Dehalococcoidia bacterium]
MPPPRLKGPRPRKALGQHFLRDSGVLADIVHAVRVPEGGVLVEIGAGTGQLTEVLLAAGHHVIAVEVEERLFPHLRQRFRGNPRFTLVQADARDVDFGVLLPPTQPFSVAGNLPYFAANPIIRHLLEGERKPAEAVVMVQREVARELAAKPGHFSMLTVSVQVYSEAEILFDVPPEAFDPPPNVWSSVVRLTLRDEPLVPTGEVAAFFTLVARTFRNPRKQIHNALTREVGLTAEQGEEALLIAGIDRMRRAETLGIDEWQALLSATREVRTRGS